LMRKVDVSSRNCRSEGGELQLKECERSAPFRLRPSNEGRVFLGVWRYRARQTETPAKQLGG